MNILLVIIALTIISGLIWLVDAIFWAKQRKLFAEKHKSKEKLPLLVDYAKSLFPIFIIVLLIRSFIFQPYKVPTGSLEPTVMPGDYLFVTQYNYGLHFPVWHWTLLKTDKPKVGDIAVFKWPVNPHINLIKRVIGLPGDKISYVNKVLYINGKEESQKFIRTAVEDDGPGQVFHVNIMQEDLNGIKHDVYVQPGVVAHNFYNVTVPKGQYFVMGDNRDNSDDSRYWGFVPIRNFVGKADFIFFSWDGFGRQVKWNRVGDKL